MDDMQFRMYQSNTFSGRLREFALPQLSEHRCFHFMFLSSGKEESGELSSPDKMCQLSTRPF